MAKKYLMVKKKVGRPKKTDQKPKVYKKRGRKPKGGKIIAKNVVRGERFGEKDCFL